VGAARGRVCGERADRIQKMGENIHGILVIGIFCPVDILSDGRRANWMAM
jgi:hypothetical protein